MSLDIKTKTHPPCHQGNHNLEVKIEVQQAKETG